MATYKGIKGVKVVTKTSDPTASEASGTLWYNSTGDALKYATAGAGAWASGTNLPRNAALSANIGISTAGMVIMGTPPYSRQTTKWNGSAWTEGNDTNHLAGSMQLGFGSTTAGVIAGCYQSSPTIPALDTSEEYDGTSWANSNDMINTHTDGTAAGTLTAGLAITGAGGPQTGPEVEEYDGTSWTAGGDLITGRARPQGSSCGTQTAALCIAGDMPDKKVVEQYDGTSWTAAPSLNSGTYNGGGCGTQTAALSFGGYPTLNTTESYNGSAWSTENTLGTGRGYANGMGTQASAMYCSGQPGGGYSNTVEEWNDPVYTIKTVTVS